MCKQVPVQGWARWPNNQHVRVTKRGFAQKVAKAGSGPGDNFGNKKMLRLWLRVFKIIFHILKKYFLQKINVPKKINFLCLLYGLTHKIDKSPSVLLGITRTDTIDVRPIFDCLCRFRGLFFNAVVR